MNKKGLELSINFLVIIILMIVVIGLGITIFSDILSTGEEFRQSVDESTRRQINSMLNTGEPVVIPRDTAEVNVGGSHIFYVGILNEIKMNDRNDFHIGVETDPSSGFNIVKQANPIPISTNDYRIIPVKIEVENAESGKTYIFDVNVCYQDPDPPPDMTSCNTDLVGAPHQYYLPQKIYLNVR